MSDWYARRVAQERGVPTPPPQPPAYPQAPPSYPQQTPGWPPQHPQPVQGHPAPQNYAQPNVNQLTEQQIIEAARAGNQGVTPMDVLNQVGARGGKGTRTERDLCPECGSNQYFQRKGASKMGIPPAPYCHTCGYNGMYEQYGTMEPPVTPEG